MNPSEFIAKWDKVELIVRTNFTNTATEAYQIPLSELG